MRRSPNDLPSDPGLSPSMKASLVANGKEVQAELPVSIEAFLRSQNVLPRSVVVEQNGEAVAPSEFGRRMVNPGDRLEIVRIVAGG